MKKLYISADAFQRDCVRLAKKVLADASWRPDRILALWRGGAQPGVILSEVFAFLGRPTPHFVLQCSSYAGIGERLRCVSFCNADALISSITAGEKILVVDDVFDLARRQKPSGRSSPSRRPHRHRLLEALCPASPLPAGLLRLGVG